MAGSTSKETDPSHGCILVFGMPRSGTTWLGKLFDSHPDTLYRHEPDSWHPLAMPRYPELTENHEFDALIRSFMDDLPSINALRVAGKLPLFPKSYLSRPRARVIEGGIWLSRLGSRFGRDVPIFMHSAAANYPRRRVVWKSIESLGRTGTILHALPDARGIHILRHPCGYIASVLRGLKRRKFTGNFLSEDYGIFNATIGTPLGNVYGLSQEMLTALSPEERAAWRWVLTNEKALQESSTSGRMLTMRYENVCRDPLARVEQMFEFTGLEVPEQTRAFIAASTAHAKSGYYSVFKDPLTVATRWQQELDKETIDRVLAIVCQSPFASYYGVDSDTTGRA